MENKVCPECEKPMEQDESVCPACGGAAEPEDPAPEAPKLGMKWHHFLSGWLLWIGIAGILSSIIGIILCLATPELLIPLYTPVDLTFSILQFILTIGISILVIRAWLDLEHYRKAGPKRYMAQYGISVTAGILLGMVESGVKGLPVFDFSIVINLAIAALFLHWNAVYFRKRAHLYVN